MEKTEKMFCHGFRRIGIFDPYTIHLYEEFLLML